jgi:hypothetical protein
LQRHDVGKLCEASFGLRFEATARRITALTQARGLIGVSELNIGKWYDPISQRWIVPRELPSNAPRWQARAETVLKIQTGEKTQRIWELLVDCCARG